MKTKKIYLRMLILSLSGIGLFISCSDDDNANIPVIETSLEETYTINNNEILSLAPNVSGASFQWKVEAKGNITKDSIIGTSKELDFISLYAGQYTVSLSVLDKGETIRKHATEIIVNKKIYSPYISKVFDYFPAVGQNTNLYPKFEKKDTKETMIQKVEESIKGVKGGMVHLGGFGGYLTFGFDHTIINLPNEKDFQIKGNAFNNNAEPGIIMVAYDKNKNGLPDDEWFEIAGSEYNNPETIKQYEITYHKPKEDASSKEYIFWEDNQGNSGYKTRINSTRTYYPAWTNETKITFKGTLLPDNAVDNGGMWALPSYDWGYADNVANSDEASHIDIDWAVDSNGKAVKLVGIDFIKVYTGINQEAGWLGEVSTEVTGAVDLHLEKQKETL